MNMPVRRYGWLSNMSCSFYTFSLQDCDFYKKIIQKHKFSNNINKVIKVFIFVCMAFISCVKSENKIEEKIIVNKTAQELIAEFSVDWENVNNFYKGKHIEVSGVYLLSSRKYIYLGEYPLEEYPVGDFIIDKINAYTKDNISIICRFNNYVYSYRLKQDEKMIIQGEYEGFDNWPEYKGIRIINCNIVFREDKP